MVFLNGVANRLIHFAFLAIKSQKEMALDQTAEKTPDSLLFFLRKKLFYFLVALIRNFFVYRIANCIFSSSLCRVGKVF